MSDLQLNRYVKQQFSANRVLFTNTDLIKPARISEDSQMVNGQLLLLIPSVGDRLQSYLQMALLQSQMSRKDGDW